MERGSVPNIEIKEGVEGSLVRSIWDILRAHFLFFLLVLAMLHYLRRRHLSPLRHIPGPLIASCSRVWKVWSTASGHTERDHIELHRQYGPIVRIAPNEVSFSSPYAAREILTAGKGFHKTDFYGVFPPPENPDIFTETRESVHAQKKRVAAAPYSMKAMQGLATFVDNTIELLVKKLDHFAETPEKVLDFGGWLHYFAFDVLGEVGFSKKFGFLEAGYDIEGAIRTIDRSQWYNGIVGQVPFLDKFLRRNPLWQWIPFLSTRNALITRITLSEIEKRKALGSKEIDRHDLLSQLLKGHEDGPDKFGEGDVFAVAHGAIFAGSDSTASTMQSFFYYVLNDKAVYAKVTDEIDEATESGKLPQEISFADAQELPYFQAALKEAMRMRPAVGLNITRLAPSGGVILHGQRFPEGTRLAVNGWVLHRDRGVFGPDADAYRPERWLENNEENIKLMDRHMFQFGGGSHLCIGKNLALLEMNKVVPTLLRNYHFELAHPGEPLKYHSTFFVVQWGLEAHISKRVTARR